MCDAGLFQSPASTAVGVEAGTGVASVNSIDSSVDISEEDRRIATTTAASGAACIFGGYHTVVFVVLLLSLALSFSSSR